MEPDHSKAGVNRERHGVQIDDRNSLRSQLIHYGLSDTGGSTPSGSITLSGYTQTTDRVLGRDTAGTGAIEELGVGHGIQIASGSLGLITGDKGDVTISGDASTLTVTQETLAAVRGLTPAADQMPYWTGTTTAANTALTVFARSILDDADAAAVRTTIGAQALDADLTALAAVTIAADQLIYGTGDVAWARTTLTAFARSLLDDADAAAARTTLGLGAVALLATIANANMATMGAATVKGSVGGDAPDDLTMTQLQSISKVKLRTPFHADGGSSCQLGAHPSTEQFLKNLNINIQIADLSTFSQVRMFCRIYTNSASSNTPRLIAKYKTSYSTTVGDFSDIGTSEVSTSLASYTLANTGWINLAAGAKIDDCFITVTQIGGDSSATPRVSSLMMEFR